MSHCSDRLKIIDEKIKDLENREGLATSDAREIAALALAAKGWSPEDITPDYIFHVETQEAQEDVAVDYAVRLDGRSVMAVKCSMSVDSRERHAVAIARLMDEPPALYAIVTDGLVYHVLDAMTGKLISHEIPSKDEAMIMLKSMPSVTIPEQKLQRERCVLLAFECAVCPRPASP